MVLTRCIILEVNIKGDTMIAMLLFTACGSWNGNWEGSCENPATGETREFVIDVDSTKGGEVSGTAFMTIKDDSGEATIINCEVSGPANGSGVDFEFACDNDESFVISTNKEGTRLLGYCDNAEEIELWLSLD